MTPVEAVLAEIRSVATDEHDKGDRFEQLMLHAFKTDRTFRHQFTGVWRWMDWPARTGADIGIDLVARDIEGRLIAIQCKCYDPGSTLTKHDIDSFVALSGQQQWARRIIVATTDHWATNAEKSLEGHAVPVERIGIDDLDAMTVDWSSWDVADPSGLKPTDRLVLRPHQVEAVEAVRAGFEEHDRGKLIMACGTGKTFTALRIAEEQAGAGRSVLFLAPSIALVAQSLKEWTAECRVPIRPFAVCSDVTVDKPLAGENATPYDLVVPPTTDPEGLVAAKVHDLPAEEMTVVFSTYQSVAVVAAMQAKTGHVFDLVVCDEAHRTAGVASVGEKDSAFGLVHANELIPAAKRLYMTATPRLFKPVAADAAKEADAILASMDDPEYFGEEFHRLGFGEAVEQGLLADYRVLILTVEEKAVSESFQHLLSTDGALTLPDVARFVGCLSGLAKLPGAAGTGFADGDDPMRRAVAFWSTISDSERFATQFEQVAEAYFDQLEAGPSGEEVTALSVPTRHVDGSTKISSRRADIRWLKETPPEDECRVLTNAKCLTEGVDVPALDAVMFLTPRRSKIDIVQAVGRVMRKPPGKQVGYVILPIAITAGLDAAKALDQNRDYDAVWEVLQALRAHDERFNAYVNRIALGSTKPGTDPDEKIKVIPVDIDGPDDPTDVQGRLFEYEEWTRAIYTKIVQKVGSRTYWEDWARDVAAIAARHEARINAILAAHPDAADAFDEFLAELHATLNDGISRDDAVSMVSQHLITRPIFEALFGDDAFGQANPVSQAMSGIVTVLDGHNLDTETDKLDDFYGSIRRRVEGIHPDDGEARQKIIKDLYGRFFKIAFPKVADSLGIVYTPIEVVDFIIRATEAALAEHFDGASLSDEGVHVLDPFTGTGTFITRLIQSGFVRPADLARKFGGELHANEILLLAYYIAAVNIEATYRQERARLAGAGPGYEPFPGIVLTDTFQLGETGEGAGAWDVFPINNERATRQKGLDIRVILGNPPYSVGQESANDDNQNLRYPKLDASIATTYAKWSTATLKNSLYDSYVRAIRWASDRLLGSSQGGIVAFVTNGGYIDSNTADGIRISLGREFHHLYVFNLRGNQRTAGEISRKEGGKIFDAGSRASVAIALLVKQPGEIPESGGALYYFDIGDYLSRDKKLSILADALPAGPRGIPALADLDWATIEPNAHGDWINQRTDAFTALLPIAADSGLSVFGLRSTGLKTGRDAWNFNSSRQRLDEKQHSMIDHFNAQVEQGCGPNSADLNPSRFKWTDKDFKRLEQKKKYGRGDIRTVAGTYRPFHKRWVNIAGSLTNRSSNTDRIFPAGGPPNLSICFPPPGSMAPPFAALMVNTTIDTGLYASSATAMIPKLVVGTLNQTGESPGLFSQIPQQEGGAGTHNVTDHALGLFRSLDSAIERDDVFFYVYGILHSPDYRATFAADLKKSLPHIPQVPTAEDFWAFANAGRELGHLHTEYETVEPWPELQLALAAGFDKKHPDAYRVLKMKHPKVTDSTTGARVADRTRIVFNEWITVEGIPERAYEYELGSRSAIGWVMEAWRVRTDKASGIVNDPNDWAAEHGDPTYILNLVGRVVAVSMQTIDVVESLPSIAL
ncbi:MAG: type ISP restriction/modification enzyme [Actinomycetota bacterium]